MEPVGVDLTYVPVVRKRKSVLAVSDLAGKLAQRLEMPTGPVVEVVRNTKKGVTVRVDDSVVVQLEDEQDMEVEWAFSDE
ncbi:hypothetical protein GGI13_005254, partial [Coemansia sp. RSA 455]